MEHRTPAPTVQDWSVAHVPPTEWLCPTNNEAVANKHHNKEDKSEQPVQLVMKRLISIQGKQCNGIFLQGEDIHSSSSSNNATTAAQQKPVAFPATWTSVASRIVC